MGDVIAWLVMIAVVVGMFSFCSWGHSKEMNDWRDWCYSQGGEPVRPEHLPPDLVRGDEPKFYYCMVGGQPIASR